MTIHYLVAGMGKRPNGGLRIIYEQARRLAARGHGVEVHHYERFASDRRRKIVRNLWHYLTAPQRSGPDWIDLPETVRRTYSLFARPPHTKPGDKVIATYWKTHEAIAGEREPATHHFNLIQGIENWFADEALLHRQWRGGSTNLTVSKHLQREVERVSGQAILIPNAVDRADFGNTNPDRTDNRTVLLCSMAAPAKGSRDAIRALETLHASGRHFTIASFGDIHPSRLGLTLPCDHHTLPDQATIRRLYNSAAIFISASHSEGWGLTLAEATLCGCTLAVSDAEGHFEFLRPGKSAFFSRRGNTPALARKIGFLLDRPSLRAALNRNAMTDLAPYDWEQSIDALERALGV